MGAFIDLTGQKYNMLTVIERTEKRPGVWWRCQCDCGNETVVSSNSLRTGNTKSCGCLNTINRKCEDLSGKKYGRLTVLRKDDVRNPSGKIKWICKCDCGVEKSIVGADLKNGKIISCGCYNIERLNKDRKNYLENNGPSFREDLTNKVFGKLTVIAFDKETTKQKHDEGKQKRSYWLCRCECGNYCSVNISDLKSGHTTSCGCKLKEWAHILGTTYHYLGAEASLIDLTNQKFGKLTVLKRSDKNDNNQVWWQCTCDCGNIIEITSASLRNNRTGSCGCLKQSRGEFEIEQYLINNNIFYQREYKFQDLKDKTYLPYDFAIFNKNNNIVALIEFDGVQHSNKNHPWYNETLHKHDIMKTDYANKNNIYLIRIPYTCLDKVELILEAELKKFL